VETPIYSNMEVSEAMGAPSHPSQKRPYLVTHGWRLGNPHDWRNRLCRGVNITGWWFQSLWRIWRVSWEGLSHILWKKQTCSKPPIRLVFMPFSHCFWPQQLHLIGQALCIGICQKLHTEPQLIRWVVSASWRLKAAPRVNCDFMVLNRGSI